MINNLYALDFKYLLLDYYKELNISEEELVVLLMMEHLLNEKNTFITKDILELKMNYSGYVLNSILASLYNKNYISLEINNGKTETKIDPIRNIIFEKFQKELVRNIDKTNDEEIMKKRIFIFELFEKEFSRNLSPIEIETINNWINSGIDTYIIINSLKDAILKNQLSIKRIDSLIVAQLKRKKNE